ncbi:MAG: hypothetical protein NTZ83_05405 [Candidatus Pacearchaeota archaeon]|nr:hypothetical protein [Candidatus Pacearchaeota archaeon]
MAKNKFKTNPLVKMINLLEAEAFALMIRKGIVGMEKNARVRKYCMKYGHRGKKGYPYTFPTVEGAVAHYNCVLCGIPYEKKPTINFRGEEIELSEARLYIDRLEKGEIPVELTGKEKRGYNLFKEAAQEELDEKEYLIGTLESLIAIQEHHDKTK